MRGITRKSTLMISRMRPGSGRSTMIDPDKTHIIFGSPGCGKTHALLEVVDNLLTDSFSPEKIAFMAFTKKAADEARDRAMRKFSLSPRELPWFRTLHSLAFRQLGM